MERFHFDTNKKIISEAMHNRLELRRKKTKIKVKYYAVLHTHTHTEVNPIRIDL